MKTFLYSLCFMCLSIPLNAQVQHGKRVHLWDRLGFTITFLPPRDWVLSKDDRQGDKIIYPQRVNFVLLKPVTVVAGKKSAAPRFVFVSTEVRPSESFDGSQLAMANLAIKRETDPDVTMTEVAVIELDGKVYRSFEYFMPYAKQTERVTYVEFSHGVLGIGVSSAERSELDDMLLLVKPLIKSLKFVPPESWHKR